jgi:hypothetical protein
MIKKNVTIMKKMSIRYIIRRGRKAEKYFEYKIWKRNLK